MIYEFPNENEPIRQGDIFCCLPNIVIDLEEIPVISRDTESIEKKKWEDLTEFPQSVALPIKQTWGIVASQDCDTSRAPVISFFVINNLREYLPPEEYKNKSFKKWMEWIIKRSKEDVKRFYLPPDSTVGFEEKMCVDFVNVIQVPRESLELRKSTLRKGRLNDIADEHFRETIAQFYRRYPYDEWYPLNKEEFNAYKEGKNETIKPFEWQ